MKAVQVLGDESSPTITTTNDASKPTPQKDEVLVQVRAAGITADELQWPDLYTTASRIPGHDVSGVIAELGPDYKGSLSIGDEVLAFLDAARGQGQADFVACLPNEVALKPKSISHAEAAALPIPILTAWEAFFTHANVSSGTRVFVSGASGAVGLQAVQIAKKVAGATVIALASARNHDKLKQFGADEVFDYNVSGWEANVKNIDVAFDTAGGDVLAKCWTFIKDSGSIITIADPAPGWAFDGSKPEEAKAHPDVKYKYFIVSANADGLSKAGKLIDGGQVKPLAVKTRPFAEAVEAWTEAKQRSRGYKIVIDF